MSSAAGGRLSPLGVALIEWFNLLPTFQTGRQITVDDLSDGERIWEVLTHIEPYYFRGDLPEEAVRGSGRWLNSWQNLKHIYKHLAGYITTQNGRLPNGPGAVDLQAIAKGDAESDEAIKLLQMVLFVVVNSEENSAFIEPMMLLSGEKQNLMRGAILEFDESAQAGAGDDAVTASAPVDKDLYWEEQIASYHKDNNRLIEEKRQLQKDLRDQNDRNARLQTHNSSLQEKLTAAEEKLEQSSGTGVAETFLKEIETKVHDQDALIAQQETEMAQLQKRNETLESENSKFRLSHEKIQPLQDELDEIKSERDQLRRSNNAIPKLRQKLEAQARVERENQELTESLEQARETVREGDKARERNRLLQQQLDENNKVIPRIEGELHDAQLMRRRAQEDSDQFRKNLEQINSEYEKAQAQIQELVDQLRYSSGPPEGVSSLESELASDQKRETELVAKNLIMWTRLTYIGRHHDILVQRDQLDKSLSEATGRIEILEKMLEVMKSRNTVLEKRVRDYISKGPEDEFQGLPVFFLDEEELADEKTSDDTKGAEEVAAELEREKAVFQHNLSNIKSAVGDGKLLLHELLEKAADENKVSIVDKQELDRLKSLEDIAGDFRAKNDETKRLQTRIIELETQLKEHQSMLRTAIGGDKLSDADAAEYLKVVQAVDKPGPKLLNEKDRAEVDGFTTGLLNELTRHRQTVIEHQQQVEKQQSTITDLQAQLQTARVSPTALKAAEQTALKQEADVLRRENRLITSAFYDLSSRLQLNNVSLQRRSETPRSFLNKQRLLVNQATAVRTR